MLRGLSTVSLCAEDLDASKEWGGGVLGIKHTSTVPARDTEFRIGDLECDAEPPIDLGPGRDRRWVEDRPKPRRAADGRSKRKHGPHRGH